MKIPSFKNDGSPDQNDGSLVQHIPLKMTVFWKWCFFENDGFAQDDGARFGALRAAGNTHAAGCCKNGRNHDLRLKMMDFLLRMMDFWLKMMDFVL